MLPEYKNGFITFNYRVSVANGYNKATLAELFSENTLIDKTVVGDQVVYVFSEGKDLDVGKTNESVETKQIEGKE